MGSEIFGGVEKFSEGVEKFFWGGGVEKLFFLGGVRNFWGWVEKFSGGGVRKFWGRELSNFRGRG